MGFLDKVRSTVAQNADKADKAIDQAAKMANDRTGGKHRDKITKATTKAKDFVDKSQDGSGSGGTTRRDPDDGGPPPPPT
jgi:hypothetical protein